MKRLLMSVMSVVVIVGVISAQSTKVDVTGVWLFTIMSGGGTGTPTVTFKQDGEKLTGHYSSMLVGEADLTGTVKGQAIEFVVAADLQGTKFEFKFTGTVDGKEMKGKLDAADLGDGTFTAKRKE
jgi:hypothetical protein